MDQSVISKSCQADPSPISKPTGNCSRRRMAADATSRNAGVLHRYLCDVGKGVKGPLTRLKAAVVSCSLPGLEVTAGAVLECRSVFVV